MKNIRTDLESAIRQAGRLNTEDARDLLVDAIDDAVTALADVEDEYAEKLDSQDRQEVADLITKSVDEYFTEGASDLEGDLKDTVDDFLSEHDLLA